jgi:hypothetical protein
MPALRDARARALPAAHVLFEHAAKLAAGDQLHEQIVGLVV